MPTLKIGLDQRHKELLARMNVQLTVERRSLSIWFIEAVEDYLKKVGYPPNVLPMSFVNQDKK